jgi:hypothetical protein
MNKVRDACGWGFASTFCCRAWLGLCINLLLQGVLWQRLHPTSAHTLFAQFSLCVRLSGRANPYAAGRFVAASASKPNPFSKAAMEARGFTVGPNNRVVPAILRDMPQQAAFALMNQVAPVMEMLTAPQNQVCTCRMGPCACVILFRQLDAQLGWWAVTFFVIDSC